MIKQIISYIRCRIRKFLFSDEEIVIGADYCMSDYSSAIVCKINKSTGKTTVISEAFQRGGSIEEFDRTVRHLAKTFNARVIADCPPFYPLRPFTYGK